MEGTVKKKMMVLIKQLLNSTAASSCGCIHCAEANEIACELQDWVLCPEEAMRLEQLVPLKPKPKRK